MKVIKEKMTPLMIELEEEKVDIFSLTMFLSTYVSELLKEIDDKDKKEVILRKMMD